MEQKASSSKTNNTIDKSLGRLIKRQKTQITHIRNERGDITSDSGSIKNVVMILQITLYYIWWLPQKPQSIKLNQDETGNLSSPLIIKELEFVK